jgi:SAM-dependent methyltransferase
VDYSEDYHRSVGEGAERSARVIARIVHALVRPESVVDVGCGIGEWLLAFAELGVGDYLGVDAPDLSEDLLSIDSERFLARDLGESLALRRTFDLAVSLEVAEHLPPERGEGFVEDLCRLAPAVLFSAAVPGQGDPESTGHVNERWQSYWASLFQEHGYGRVECVRPAVWEDPRVEIWYRQNTVLYVSAERLSSDAVLGRSQRENAAFPASVVHPDPTSEHLASRTAQRENRRLKRRIRRLKERLDERPDSEAT